MAMKIFPDPESSREIEALAQTFNMHGVLVKAWCFRVTEPKAHFEIVLEGRGESAIVDISLGDEKLLSERIEQAAASFSASLDIRSVS